MTRQDTSMQARRGAGWTLAEWLLGIVGGIAAFLGLFVLFGNEDEYIGLGGDVSWRVGDVSTAWMIGLLIGGAVLLAGAVTMVFLGRQRDRVESSPLQDLLFHAGIFTVVNAFIWIQDFAIGGGLDYAHFTTIPWAVGLAIHAGFYFSSRDGSMSAEEVEQREFQMK